jgi:hypothetical protein
LPDTLIHCEGIVHAVYPPGAGELFTIGVSGDTQHGHHENQNYQKKGCLATKNGH